MEEAVVDYAGRPTLDITFRFVLSLDDLLESYSDAGEEYPGDQEFVNRVMKEFRDSTFNYEMDNGMQIHVVEISRGQYM